MPHRLVVGQTESGKTSIAISLTEESATRGVIATVYTSIRDKDHLWEKSGAIITHTRDDYFRVISQRIKDGQKQLCVTDEAHTIFSMSNREDWWLATEGRHYGIENIFCSQRPTLLPPTIREMCSELFAFRLSMSGARLMADDFGDERILDAVKLRQGEFLYSRWKNGEKVLDKYSAFD